MALHTLDETLLYASHLGQDFLGALGKGKVTGRLVHLGPDKVGENSLPVHAAIDFLSECDEVRDIELFSSPKNQARS